MTHLYVAFIIIFQNDGFFFNFVQSIKFHCCVIVIELVFCLDEKFAKPAGPEKGSEQYGVGDMKLPANCTEKREYFFSLKTPG